MHFKALHSPPSVRLVAEGTEHVYVAGRGYALHVPPPSLLGSASSEVLALRGTEGEGRRRSRKIITSLTPETHPLLLAMAASLAFTFWPSRPQDNVSGLQVLTSTGVMFFTEP